MTTVYLDATSRTWSAPKAKAGLTKFRLRRYDDEAVQWLETKRRNARGITVKRRQQASKVPEGLTEVGRVTYSRQAYERGRVRVTVDTHITDSHRALSGSIVEVKTRGVGVPRWLRPLLPKRLRKWSKSRWGTGRCGSPSANG